MIGGWNGEVPFLIPRPVTEIFSLIACLAARIPAAFIRIDEIKTVLRRLVETYAVKNEKFSLGAEESLVGKPAGCHIFLRSLGHVPWIAVIGFLREWVGRVPDHYQRRCVAKRIDQRSFRIRHSQQVRFGN